MWRLPRARCARARDPDERAPIPAQPTQTRADAVPPSASAAPPASAAPAPASPPAAPPVELARVLARVGKNHGHSFTVPVADVLAGKEVRYSLSGPHEHFISLGPEDLQVLQRGEILRVRSTEANNHKHRLWLRGAPAVDPPEWISACKATFTGKDEHELVIPAADLASTVERTYDVQGIAGHAHQVTLAPADFDKLRRGGPVTVHTSREVEDVHLHTVTIEVLARRR